MKNNVRKYLLVVVAVTLILAIGIGFAYFTATVLNEGSTNVTVTTSELAELIFEGGDPLSIDAGMSNFYESAGNQASSTYPTATLVANEAASASYYVYFYITENEFVYTTDIETPELILTIYDENGTEVESVDGLDYITYGEGDSAVSGFDITTATGLFAVAENKEISKTTSDDEEHEWTFTLTFVNLDTNQNENAGKTFVSEVIMQAEAKTSGSAVETEGTLAYTIVQQDGGAAAIVEKTATALANGTLHYGDTVTTDEGLFSAEDDYGISYYYRGATEDNYVEFAGMLWRIIRIDGSGNIKLMLYNDDVNDKTDGYESIGTSAFNSEYSDPTNADYSKSDVKDYVDDWYEDYLLTYQSYLASTDYCVDLSVSDVDFGLDAGDYLFGTIERFVGADFSGETFDLTYKCETSIDGIDVYSYYVGLISADEIGYAGVSLLLDNSDFYLYSGFIYWSGSASNFFDGDALSFCVNDDGFLGDVWVNYGRAVLPVVSLSSSAQYSGGDGSIGNPYTIVM